MCELGARCRVRVNVCKRLLWDTLLRVVAASTDLLPGWNSRDRCRQSHDHCRQLADRLVCRQLGHRAYRC